MFSNSPIHEETMPEEFWKYNNLSPQNQLFYIHLIQDKAYDRYIKSVIDVTDRHLGKYFLQTHYGKVKLRDDDLIVSGLCYTEQGILSELDDQFYVRLAKRYYKATGELADEVWISSTMKYTILKCYPPALAASTIKQIYISDKVKKILKNRDFDDESWIVPNKVVDSFIDSMLEDMYNAFERSKI